MPSKVFGPSVSTNSGSALTLYYDGIEVSSDGASARLTNPRAVFTFKSGWSDGTNSFTTVNTSAVSGASHGSRSLSGGVSQTFSASSKWVGLSYNGPTYVEYKFQVYGVSFFNGDSATTTYTFGINLPTRVSTVGAVSSAPTGTMGSSMTFSWTQPDPNSTMSARAVAGGNISQLTTKSTATSASWTPSTATLAPLFPNTATAPSTLYVDYYDVNGKYTGTAEASFTLNIPTSVVPTAGTVSLAEADAAVLSVFGASTNKFIRTKSKITATNNGAAGVYDSTITKVEVLVNGSAVGSFASTANGGKMTWGPINISGTSAAISKRVTDSRGRTSTSPTVTVSLVPYSVPTVPAMRAYRSVAEVEDGSGTQITVETTASASSLVNGSTQKNTLTYKILAKKSTDVTFKSLYTSALPAGTLTISPASNGKQTLTTQVSGQSIPFEADSVFDIKVEVTDAFGEVSKQVKTAIVSTEIVPLSISGVGIGVGKIWEFGALDVKGHSYFEGNVSVTGGIDAGGNIFTEGGFYSSNNAIPSGANLNDYVDTATYTQSSSAYAAAGANYPEPTAGLLEVSSNINRSWVYQRYTTYLAHKTYMRKRQSGTWSEWKLVSEPIVSTSWTSVAYINGWKNFSDASWHWAEYRRVGDTVELRGMMSHTTAAQASMAFVLPVGFRPTKILTFPVMASGGLARVDLDESGQFFVRSYYAGGTSAWLNLTTVRFAIN